MPNDIDISDESGCGNCDGSVCLSIDGNPVSFSVGMTDDTNGCVSNLCAGSYTMVFEDVVSNGVTISNPDFTFELEEFQVSIALSADGTAVQSTLVGGTGPFLISWTTAGNNTGNLTNVAFDIDGCYSITVTDLTTSCTTSASEYIYTENIGLGLDAIGDLNDDGFINATDLLEFLGDFGASNADPNWSSLSDFNCDGIVNTFDLLFFLSVFPG